MKRWLPMVVAAAQVLVLAFMAGQREWIARTGRTIYLRTAPVDPNDPMRGDYVRFGFEISTVEKSLCRGAVVSWMNEETYYSRERRDERVYAALELDESGVATLVSLSDEPPAEGLYLRGRVDWIDSRSVRVRYGTEALFMQQGRAREFEMVAWRDKVGVPVNLEVAVSPSGIAVTKGYRWEPLGITFTLERRLPSGEIEESQRRFARGPVIGANITLKNHGDEPVAIVDLPKGRSFRLVRDDRWGSSSYRPAEPLAPPPSPMARDVIVLQPGGEHVTQIDLTRPEWFVIKDAPELAGVPTQPGSDVPVSIESLVNDWNTSFRFEYVPPSREVSAGLPDAGLIRHSRLRSRVFNAVGAGD